MPEGQPLGALVGKAGEALVAAELLRQGIDVAYPAYDGGVDLIAYEGHKFSRVVPIQVKTRSGTNFTFHKGWFEGGIVLVQVWFAVTSPEFYVFTNLDQVEQALGEHANTTSWNEDGRYHVGNPTRAHIERLRPHRSQWSRIKDRLK
jgi:hypothetical protein